MEYADSLALGGEEWASDIDWKIRQYGLSRSDFGPHICEECQGPATMVAVGVNPGSVNGEYGPSPHFRISHRQPCEISGMENRVKKGVVVPARSQMPTGASFPARLSPPTEREVQTRDPKAAVPDRQSSRNPAGTIRRPSTRPRGSDVATIRPACTHFAGYRDIGFEDRTLELPGRSEDEPTEVWPYASAFQRLGNWHLTLVPNKIVYAPLMFRQALEVTDDYLAIPLFAGPIEGTVPEHPHRLRFDWSAWTPQRRQALRDRVDQHRSDARKDWTDKRNETLVFAYAAPTVEDVTDLVVDDYASFCIIHARKRQPKNRAASTAGPKGRR